MESIMIALNVILLVVVLVVSFMVWAESQEYDRRLEKLHMDLHRHYSSMKKAINQIEFNTMETHLEVCTKPKVAREKIKIDNRKIRREPDITDLEKSAAPWKKECLVCYKTSTNTVNRCDHCESTAVSDL